MLAVIMKENVCSIYSHCSV